MVPEEGDIAVITGGSVSVANAWLGRKDGIIKIKTSKYLRIPKFKHTRSFEAASKIATSPKRGWPG